MAKINLGVYNNENDGLESTLQTFFRMQKLEERFAAWKI
jgi:hypothetical protein